MNDECILLVGQMRCYNSNKIINSYNNYFSKYKSKSIDLYISTWDKSGYSNRHGDLNYNKDYLNNFIDYKLLYNHYSNYDFFNIKKNTHREF
tara:strand:- start:399 stop:674 length:276 start_codon:yes stop_codon:yes gene_type:complete